MGRPPSSIARWESAQRTPSLEVLAEAAEACGFTLSIQPQARNHRVIAEIDQLLPLTPANRIRSEAPEDWLAFEFLKQCWRDEQGGPQCEVIGDLAARSLGVPVRLQRRTVELCIYGSPQDSAAINRIANPLGGQLGDSAKDTPEGALRWEFPDGSALEVHIQPRGTQGYHDLRAHGESVEILGNGKETAVASLEDLARIATCTDVPAGRAQLELIQQTVRRHDEMGLPRNRTTYR